MAGGESAAALLANVDVGAAHGMDQHADEETERRKQQKQNAVVNRAGRFRSRLRGLVVAQRAGLRENRRRKKEEKQRSKEATKWRR